MSVTESFEQLKAEIDKAESAVKAAAQDDEADIQAKVDDARKQADNRAAELRAKTGDASKEGKSHWQEMQADWDRHIKVVHQRMDATKTAVDRDVAVRHATEAYEDAVDAIEFAQSAIAEAEYATLEALRAEENARSLGAAL
jgi:chromosome segregation ATPase